MRRPTRPQRPALVAGELIVHPPELHCKLFFTRFYRHFCVFVCFPDSCIVMQHNARFCWCRCLCELNRRRRVRRFKRRCACGGVFVRLACLRAFLPPCSALQCRPPLRLPFALPAVACLHMRARDSSYTQGGTGYLKCLGGGGVTSTYNSNSWLW